MADSHTTHDSPIGSPQKLMERVRHAIRLRHYSHRTEEAYVYWIRRDIVFHRKQHRAAMGAPDVSAFLEWLAVRQGISASTQNQALCALLFLYRELLHTTLARSSRCRVPARRRPCGGPEPGRGRTNPETVDGRVLDHRRAAVRRRASPAGRPRASREGRRLRSQSDRGPARQGPEGPSDDVAGRRERAAEGALGRREAAARAGSRCWKTATTFAPCRSCSAIRTSVRRWCTCTC